MAPMCRPILLFLLLIHLVVIHCEEADVDALYCPSAVAIHPCRCDRQGLSCIGLGADLDESVACRVFRQEIPPEMEVDTDDSLENIIQLANRSRVEFHYYRNVWLQGTNLGRVSKDTFGLYSASNINLDYNQIATFEVDALANSYKTLIVLTLYHNKLKTFPFEDIRKMYRLESLSLGHNQLEWIPDEAFSRHPALQNIILNNNKIKVLGQQAFAELTTLRRLSLAHNQLEQIGDRVIAAKNLDSLVLDLSGNSIRTISPLALERTFPIVLNLSANALTHLDYYVFAPMLNTMMRVNGGALIVSDNPLTCLGCNDNRWLIINKLSLSRVLQGFQCRDGRQLFDLDPLSIGCVD